MVWRSPAWPTAANISRGHGFVEADSHLAMPVDPRPLAEILGADAQPYSWLGLSLSAIMPAHVVYPQVDDKPAGFSRIWLQNILRDQLGFNGLIFSDDLSMEGARMAGGVVQSAEAALHAGCDMVLVCNQPASADELLAGLKPSVARAGGQRRIKQMKARGTLASLEQTAASAGISECAHTDPASAGVMAAVLARMPWSVRVDRWQRALMEILRGRSCTEILPKVLSPRG